MSKKPLLIGLALVVIALVEVIPVMSYGAGVSAAYQTSNCNALPPPAVCSQLSSQLSIPWILFTMLGIAVLLGMFVSVRAVQGRYA